MRISTAGVAIGAGDEDIELALHLTRTAGATTGRCVAYTLAGFDRTAPERFILLIRLDHPLSPCVLAASLSNSLVVFVYPSSQTCSEKISSCRRSLPTMGRSIDTATRSGVNMVCEKCTGNHYMEKALDIVSLLGHYV